MTPCPEGIEELDNMEYTFIGPDAEKNNPLSTEHFTLTIVYRGEAYQRIEYNLQEQATWKEVFVELNSLYPKYACKEFNELLPQFGLNENIVPQIEDLSNILQERAGWTIKPVNGLLTPQNFFKCLSHGAWPTSTHVRHPSRSMFPHDVDLLHDVLGHMILLTNPDVSRVIKMIGKAATGATDENFWQLVSIFWRSIEFGVVLEGDEIKAIGASILSNVGEMQCLDCGKCLLRRLDPVDNLEKMMFMNPYSNEYFVSESFEATIDLLEWFTKKVSKET